MKSLVSFPRYEGYKESGVDWIGDIPVEWETQRLKYILQEVNERSHKGLELLLSVSQYTGVTPRKTTEKESDLALESASLEGYKLVEENDLVSNIMLAWNGSLGFSKYFGIVSPAYAVYRLYKNFYHGYYHYLFITDLYKAEYKRKSTGVIDSRLRLYTESFYSIEGLVPPYSEQKLIATYLDQKTAQIDQAINIKKKQIELLKERQQVVIQQAVTKGLDPSVKMKDSGIKWIGEVPEHWGVKKLKFLATINNGIDYKHVEVHEGYPVIGSGGQFTYASKFLYSGEAVLLGRKGTIDKPLYIDGPFWTVDTMFYCVCNENVSAKYIYYCAKTIPFSFYSTATALPSMTQTDLLNHFLALPQVDEQETIVYYLDQKTTQIEQAIDIQNQQIKKLQEYKFSLINSAVTGKIKITPDMIAAEG